jgi:very-short-patch-repair endonuclease
MVKATDVRIEQLAKRQHGVVSWRQLERLHITRHQIRRQVRIGQWVRQLPGVWRMRWAEPTWLQRVWCASLWAGSAACISHRTAAQLWELDGVKLDKVEMSGEIRQRNHGDWLVFHRTAPIPKQMQRTRKGVPLTSPARTLVDLAGVCDDEVVERAMEHAFRWRIASVNEVHHVLRRIPTWGKAGTRRVARLLKRGVFSPEMHSELERQALRMFRRFGLPEPRCHYEVAADDFVLGFVDFAWPKGKVIVEAEGFQFHSGREAWESDIDRYNAMTLRGWKVLRLTYTDLHDPTRAFCRALAKAMLL